MKAFYPVSGKDATFLCWHTGLVTATFTEIYCLMSRYDKKAKDDQTSNEDEAYRDSEYPF